MLVVEFVVVVEAILSAEQFKVAVADDQCAPLVGQCRDCGVGIELTGILQGFVIVAETAHLHEMQSVEFVNHDVEVAHDEVGEIEACQFK